MSSWWSKALKSAGTFGQKALGTFNSIGSTASSLAHTALENPMIQGALAANPGVLAGVMSAVEGGDALLTGTKDFEAWMTPAKTPDKPAKPSYAGLEKKAVYRPAVMPPGYREGLLLDPKKPKKPKRPDWSFDQGYISNRPIMAPPKPTKPPRISGTYNTELTESQRRKRNRKVAV
jgi:hypothetical protein